MVMTMNDKTSLRYESIRTASVTLAWMGIIGSVFLVRLADNGIVPLGRGVALPLAVCGLVGAVLFLGVSWMPTRSRAAVPTPRRSVPSSWVVLVATVGLLACGELIGQRDAERATSIQNFSTRIVSLAKSEVPVRTMYIGCGTCRDLDTIRAAYEFVVRQVPEARVRWIVCEDSELSEIMAIVKADPVHFACRRALLAEGETRDAIRGGAVLYEGGRQPPRVTKIESSSTSYAPELLTGAAADEKLEKLQQLYADG